jgi:hypothetical protein
MSLPAYMNRSFGIGVCSECSQAGQKKLPIAIPSAAMRPAFYNTRRPDSSLDRQTPDQALLQRPDANEGCSIITAETHLAKCRKLFKQSEPARWTGKLRETHAACNIVAS